VTPLVVAENQAKTLADAVMVVVVVREQGRSMDCVARLDCLLSINTIFVVYSKFIFVREYLRKIHSKFGIMTGFSIGKFNPKSLCFISF
jgi:hypothetical protein